MIKIPANKVAVIPLYDPDTTPSGRIIIPETARERVDQGIVKYVGNKVKDIEIGDHVLFSGYSGQLVSLEGEGKLIILVDDFVIAVLPDPPNIEVPGLYFRRRIVDSVPDFEYFPATYEVAMEFLAKTLEGLEYFQRIRVQTPRPKQEEYDRMR